MQRYGHLTICEIHSLCYLAYHKRGIYIKIGLSYCHSHKKSYICITIVIKIYDYAEIRRLHRRD